MKEMSWCIIWKMGVPSLIKRIENGDRAGCHQIILHEPYILVPCLEQNIIRLFDKENGYIPAGEILFPKAPVPGMACLTEHILNYTW